MNCNICKPTRVLLFKFIGAFLLLSISQVVVSENTDRSQAEPVCQRDDILLCENWEDGDHVGWQDYYSWVGDIYGGHTCSTGDCPYNFAGFQSTHATLLRLPENDRDAIYPYAQFNTSAGVNDTLYARYYVYWSPNFVFNVTNTKNFYFRTNSGRYRVGMFFRPGRSSLYSETVEDLTLGQPYIHLYCNQIEVTPGSPEQQYCDYQGGDLRYFANQPDTNSFRVKGGQWYSVELRVTPNPSGQPFGGRIQFWIDGVLLADYQNVSIRKTGETDPFNAVWVSSYFGGGPQDTHPDQYVIYDNIVVSTSPIGTISGDPTPEPKAPVLFIDP